MKRREFISLLGWRLRLPFSRRHVARGLLPSDWGGDIRDTTGTFGE